MAGDEVGYEPFLLEALADRGDGLPVRHRPCQVAQIRVRPTAQWRGAVFDFLDPAQCKPTLLRDEYDAMACGGKIACHVDILTRKILVNEEPVH